MEPRQSTDSLFPSIQLSSRNKLRNWRPLQLSTKLQRSQSFKSPNSTKPVSKSLKIPMFSYDIDEELELGRPTCGKQFHQYCKYTTMHGIRYLAEDRRHFSEKIFWSCWCVFGVTAAIYLMSKIYTRWESSPVITSVASTNFPVTNVNFPAITICTVNKAVHEKLIIQACNLNITYTKMRNIISVLVDPESRNNDNDPDHNDRLNSTMRIKLLRLVAPKCEDYILTCRWNEARTANCSKLFNLTLTDTGYCCTFNAAHAKIRRTEKQNDADVLKSEHEFVYLQQAIWDYVDYRDGKKRPGPPVRQQGNAGTTTTPPTMQENYFCNRTFDDDLFPGICEYLKIATIPAVINKTEDTMSTPTFPLKALGAGRSRGLTLLLDTLRCGAVPTETFKGLRVLVHDPEEFPAVGERGFIVGPGMETQVAVTATDTYSPEVLRAFAADRRGCYFSDEYPLDYHPQYSRSSCVLECENKYILNQCHCLPYYAPGNSSSHMLCSIEHVPCISGATGKNLSTTTQPDRVLGLNCTESCLPACNETFYNFVVTAALFPNQHDPNMTKILRDAAQGGKREGLQDIQYIRGSVSLLRVFFRESSIMQYKRGELFTWEDFVSNLGGVMGLCLGFSLLSLVELIYFFTMRTFLDWKNYKHIVEDVERSKQQNHGVIAQNWM